MNFSKNLQRILVWRSFFSQGTSVKVLRFECMWSVERQESQCGWSEQGKGWGDEVGEMLLLSVKWEPLQDIKQKTYMVWFSCWKQHSGYSVENRSCVKVARIKAARSFRKVLPKLMCDMHVAQTRMVAGERLRYNQILDTSWK